MTLLSGHGGEGKSLLSLMLAVATAAGATWLGLPIEKGGVVYLSCEDEIDEVHRRLHDICAAEGVDLAEFGNLAIIPLAGESSVMAVQGKGGVMTPTPLWAELISRLEQMHPALLVIDNAADVFGGEEIVRAQVRQFISMLRSLAFKIDCTILILSHPSISGLSSGTGLSGSTHWHNSVRSRLYLTRPNGGEDKITDPDLRVLQSMKSNYGPLAAEISIRWRDGRFVNESGAPAPRPSKEVSEATAEAVFIDLLQDFNANNRNVSANKGPTYGPAQFANHRNARGVTSKALTGAMERLINRGLIRNDKFGAPSKERTRLVFINQKTEA